MTRSLACAVALIVLAVPSAHAQKAGVASTVHNLSATGPGPVKAESETEVCKFCHIPHNAVAAEPLWGHVLSRVGTYSVPYVGRNARAPAPQPDGSSRLCLACHDGTIALEDVTRLGPAGPRRVGAGQSGLGTDLSGSHPVSMVVPDGDSGDVLGGRDMGLRTLGLIRADPDVRLDANGKIQCTSCHDPHADLYYRPGLVPHFWVKQTVTEVCLVCHEPR